MSAASPTIELRTDRVIRVLAPISLVHSVVYLCLLVVWIGDGPASLRAIFGLTHGVLWIAMSLVCVTLAARRLLPLRTAVAVAILGGIGPFVGTYEFMRLRRTGGATFRS